MDNVLVWEPDDRLVDEYLSDFHARRAVRQNLFYLTGGASSFYSYRGADLEQIKWQDECTFFSCQPFWSEARDVAFVSLGCGNAQAERMLLRESHAAGPEVAYFGVDSSRAMLELARETLVDEAFPRTFIQADFTLPGFAERLHALTERFDTRVYAVIGGTFGNFEQRAIASTLAGLVPPGDYLYLDVVPRYSDELEEARLRDRWSRLPDNLRGFFARLLETLCIADDAGAVRSEAAVEPDLNSLRYTFYFEATRTTTLTCFSEPLTLEPGERVELLSVRAYDPEALKAFLRRWGFAFVDAYVPDVGDLQHLWQRFLFRKQRA